MYVESGNFSPAYAILHCTVLMCMAMLCWVTNARSYVSNIRAYIHMSYVRTYVICTYIRMSYVRTYVANMASIICGFPVFLRNAIHSAVNSPDI